MKDRNIILTIIGINITPGSIFKGKYRSIVSQSVPRWIDTVKGYRRAGVKHISFLITFSNDLIPRGDVLAWQRFMAVFVNTDLQLLKNEEISTSDDISAVDLYKVVQEILQPNKINGLKVINNNWERSGENQDNSLII